MLEAEKSLQWLPPIITLSDYEGDWNRYLEAIYSLFKVDFVDSKPTYNGKKLAVKRHPLSNNRECTFWHIISEGKDEASRTPNLRRCERIRWPRPIIENHNSSKIKVWETERNNETRICIWLEELDYMVILANRSTYTLFWTAFVIEYDHTRKKYQRQYEKYIENQTS